MILKVKSSEILKKANSLKARHKFVSVSAGLLFAVFLGSTLISNSPATAVLPAPGGVEGAALWVKADGTGLTVNGSNQVEHWDDQSGSGFIATEAQASYPAHTNTITPSNSILKVNNGINFNPAVDFSGSSSRTLKGAAVSAWNSADINIFSAAFAEGSPSGGLSGIFAINGTWTSGVGVSGGGLGYYGPSKSFYLDGSGCSVATAAATDGPHIVRGVYVSATTGLGGSTWLDGAHKGTGTSCGKGSTYDFFEIGGRTTGTTTYDNRVFNGLIPEVIVYNSALTALEAQRINSYLAIKYGVTLDPSVNLDYLASNGTTKAWDAAANAGYYNNVTGIGRDDNSALNQKQSKSVNAQGIVTVGHNTIESTNQANANNFAANNSFLIFGDDNNSVGSWVDTGVPALDTYLYKRIPRTWKVQKTGTVGAVTVQFDVDDPEANIPAPLDGTYYFINLTTGTATPMSSAGGGNFSVGGLTLNNNDLLTIGTSAGVYNVRYRKTVDPILTTIPPGETFEYTVTAENIGNVPLTGLSFTDDLTDVADDATYQNDVSATDGSASYNGGTNEISWSGDLGIGETVTVTYSFEMNDPTTGDGVLTNSVVGTGPGTNCTEDPAVDPDCTTTTPLPVLASQKTLVGPSNPQAGDTVDYEFTIANLGGAAASNVVVADDLTEVLDDAIYNNDHSATSGSLSYNPLTDRLSWNGSLAANGNAGDTVTVTFSVTVNAADNLGDAMLNNALISPDCPNPPIFTPGPGYDADCVTSTPISAWMATKNVSPISGVDPGETVTYTIEVENTGAIDLTGGNAPSLDDDLTDVIDDAVYNNDVTASSGTPSYSDPVLSWTGDLNAGQTATLNYTATVNQLDALANAELANAIGTGPMNCPVAPTTNPGDPTFNADCAVLSAVTLPESTETLTPGGDLSETGQNQRVVIFVALGILVSTAVLLRFGKLAAKTSK